MEDNPISKAVNARNWCVRMLRRFFVTLLALHA
ncbi:hypothetical protein QF001_006033 [Paraburkholderia youngii]